MNIRRMLRQDLHSLGAHFKCPLDLKDYYKCRDVDAFVLEFESELRGYFVAMSDAYSTEILHIEVREDGRKQGMGSLMVQFVGSLVPDDTSVEVRIQEDDITMQLFLKHNGFKAQEEVTVDDNPGLLFRKGWRFKTAPSMKFRM